MTPFVGGKNLSIALSLLEPAVGFRRERNFVAMFHFRLKSDKKKNGTKVSLVTHVEYINHESSFAHDKHWQESNKFVGDCITTSQTPNALDELETLLYKNQPLIINSSPDSHKAVLQTALLANLPITFVDRLLQKEFEHLKKKKARACW